MKQLSALIVLVLFLGIGRDSLSDTTEKSVIETPDGQVPVKRETVEGVPQQITILDDDQVALLESFSKPGPQFVSTYLTDIQNPDLKDYDEAFRLWQERKDSAYSAQQVVEILGSYLGMRCVADFDMEWVQISDEYGTDYAVRGKTAEVLAYPFSTVLKRVHSTEHDFLYNVYYAIQSMIESGEYPQAPVETTN